MTDIAAEIKQAFDVLGLVLVFVFVLFDVNYKKIEESLLVSFPGSDRPIQRKAVLKELQRVLAFRCFLMDGIYLALVYLLLPTLFRLLGQAVLRFWNFDLLNTAFFLVFLFILGFLFWSGWLTWKLWKHIRQEKQR